MSTRSHFGALAGTLLLVPLMAVAACEGYEEPGQDETLGEQTETEQQDMRPGEQEPGADLETRQQEREMETRSERREAETDPGARPDRPAPPTTEEGEEPTTAGTATVTMTEFSLELPENMSPGSYTLTCQLPEDAMARQSGEQAQQGRQDVQLDITVKRGQQSGQSMNR